MKLGVAINGNDHLVQSASLLILILLYSNYSVLSTLMVHEDISLHGYSAVIY